MRRSWPAVLWTALAASVLLSGTCFPDTTDYWQSAKSWEHTQTVPSLAAYHPNLTTANWTQFSNLSQTYANRLNRSLQDAAVEPIQSFGHDFLLDSTLHGFTISNMVPGIYGAAPRTYPGLVDVGAGVAAAYRTEAVQRTLRVNMMQAPVFRNSTFGSVGRSISALPNWYQTSLAETYASRLSSITVPLTTTVLQVGNAAGSFMTTAKYIGGSMQILNPPMANTQISFPTMDFRPPSTFGNQWHNVKTWVVDVWQHPITPVQFDTLRVVSLNHFSDDGFTRLSQFGRSWEHQLSTTPTGIGERIALKFFPVGSYYDPMTTSSIATRSWSITTHEVMGGRSSFSSFGTSWTRTYNYPSFHSAFPSSYSRTVPTYQYRPPGFTYTPPIR